MKINTGTSIFILTLALNFVFIQSAPTTKSRDSDANNKTRDQKELDFENFFNKMSEEVMEKAENEMEKMKEIEDEFFKQFFPSSAEQEKSSTRKKRSVKSVGKLDTRFEGNHLKRIQRSTSNTNDLKAENMEAGIVHQKRKRRSVFDNKELTHESERVRRSLSERRMNTMSRSSYRRMTFMKRSRRVVCHRRCLWRKMYFLCRYGVELDEPCGCE
ncbi:uncharacterized protein [Clytia hemisphaerica]|uniref:Cnidarian restricted protein n=1 Tax=Clytia hemisphaerica TaxID=252671 RepID=A0A7M5V3M2_9CNID|eukprot:TCONS_00000687-protein